MPLSLASVPMPEKAPQKAHKPRSAKKASEVPSAGRKASAAPKAARNELKVWAHGYVIGAALTSCALNALAFGAAAGDGLRYAAWALGVLIPCGILALGRVASLLYLRGESHRRAALALAVIAGAVLLLSVWHCTESIMALTGSPLFLAAAMAIGIDAGMVGCEVAATIAGRK